MCARVRPAGVISGKIAKEVLPDLLQGKANQKGVKVRRGGNGSDLLQGKANQKGVKVREERGKKAFEEQLGKGRPRQAEGHACAAEPTAASVRSHSTLGVPPARPYRRPPRAWRRGCSLRRGACGECGAQALVESKGMLMISDEGAIAAMVDKVCARVAR